MADAVEGEHLSVGDALENILVLGVVDRSVEIAVEDEDWQSRGNGVHLLSDIVARDDFDLLGCQRRAK